MVGLPSSSTDLASGFFGDLLSFLDNVRNGVPASAASSSIIAATTSPAPRPHGPFSLLLPGPGARSSCSVDGPTSAFVASISRPQSVQFSAAPFARSAASARIATDSSFQEIRQRPRRSQPQHDPNASASASTSFAEGEDGDAKPTTVMETPEGETTSTTAPENGDADANENQPAEDPADTGESQSNDAGEDSTSKKPNESNVGAVTEQDETGGADSKTVTEGEDEGTGDTSAAKNDAPDSGAVAGAPVAEDESTNGKAGDDSAAGPAPAAENEHAGNKDEDAAEKVAEAEEAKAEAGEENEAEEAGDGAGEQDENTGGDAEDDAAAEEANEDTNANDDAEAEPNDEGKSDASLPAQSTRRARMTNGMKQNGDDATAVDPKSAPPLRRNPDFGAASIKKFKWIEPKLPECSRHVKECPAAAANSGEEPPAELRAEKRPEEEAQ
ncbi:unnamed protein product [Amoebophrya sp. A120]|nr:unnamed protein product [Amoebophrya sp. A120]|eukprot:GSA120T00015135001.1